MVRKQVAGSGCEIPHMKRGRVLFRALLPSDGLAMPGQRRVRGGELRAG